MCPAGLDWKNIEWVLIFIVLRYLFDVYVASSTRTKLENGELQVAGDQWPVFLYTDYTYDPKDPWNGLLHSGLLISVSFINSRCLVSHQFYQSKAFKHVFTSLSSVDQEPKATRSGNAQIHGMCSTTKASLAYVATQVSKRSCFVIR